MTPIPIQDLFDPKAKRYAGGQDSEDFGMSFDYALMRSIETLNGPEVGLSGVLLPDSRDQDIQLEKTTWFGVLSDFLDYYLQENGQWGADEQDRAEAKFRRAKVRAHTLAMDSATLNTRLRGHTDTDSDSETL